MIEYARFDISFYSLKVLDDNELEKLRGKIEESMNEILPEFNHALPINDSDIDVEVVEHSGECSLNHQTEEAR